ncbi:MAG: hypothetical protein ACLGQH_05830, partial [Acidobacteriota bacterium]
MSRAVANRPRADAPTRDIAVVDGVLTLALAGSWRMDRKLPDLAPVDQALAAVPPPKTLAFACTGVTGWDSLFLTQCRAILALARQRGVAVALDGLPDGVVSLLNLAEKVPERQGAARATAHAPFL